MRYRFHTADVFTDQVFGGNPLAVLPEAEELNSETMQKIAREFNISETVFVVPPEDRAHNSRLRIFTPETELPFAGHPTIGAALLLAWIGKVPLNGTETRIVFEEEVGPVPVTIFAEDGHAARAQFSAPAMPEYGPDPPDPSGLAALLSLGESDLLPNRDRLNDRPQAISCGIPFLFVPLAGGDALARAAVRHDKWESVLSSFWASSIYAFTYTCEHEGSSLRARMFAPAMGITEDPATGAAVTALAGYLAPRAAERDGTLRWVVEQGFEMGRPSVLEVEADLEAGDVVAIRVGGTAVFVSSGEIDVP